MREVSKTELKRLKKKGNVRKKMGAQPEKERPEPVAKDSEGMSGSAVAEQPVPVLPEPAPEPAPVPHAAMAVSNAARDAAFESMVANNTQVINDFKDSLALVAKPRKRVPWDHDLIRDEKTGLLKKIRSTPLEN